MADLRQRIINSYEVQVVAPLRAALREAEARIDCGTRVEGECPTPLEPPMTPVCGYHANLWLVAEQERAGEAEAQRDRARRGGWMGALAAVSWQKLYDEQRERAEAAERERDAARQAHDDADAALQSLMAKYDPKVDEYRQARDAWWRDRIERHVYGLLDNQSVSAGHVRLLLAEVCEHGYTPSHCGEEASSG